jgi:hypothetical protein
VAEAGVLAAAVGCVAVAGCAPSEAGSAGSEIPAAPTTEAASDSPARPGSAPQVADPELDRASDPEPDPRPDPDPDPASDRAPAAGKRPCDGPGEGCTCVDEKTPPPGGLEGERPRCFPAFEGRAGPLPAAVRQEMTGVSWREGCPVHLDDLALLEIAHWDMAGGRARGELVVAARVADDVLGAFGRLYDLRFPIERMRRVDHYDADDDRSMADNNTSAFNCRPVAGTSRFSQHSYGTAIDINPVQNPYVRGERVAPPAGRDYLDRSEVRPGMLVPGPAVRAFKDLGWGWGGDWRSAKDYQHVSETGR